ncbi:phosphatase PAP2 family protein [Shewanella pneumatophori]|uniref:undecaprenyl-diphosphate phosphatase n=1 Tax=Shewanella pneumatophori TaxID=314092 RepID=A0A9X1ZK60_9GAMM|nr:phosphatase PAP2 family protein [Shewanella pneumatophori]MCL1139288.1 phosphatase PAP2 family protein [Shewanella pneumatophori]
MTSITELDSKLYRYIVQLGQQHRLQPMALKVSTSGNGPAYLYLAVACLLFDRHHESLLHAMLVAYFVELPLYFALKNMIRRPRPCHALADGCASIEPADKFSLPSGHTAAAFVMAASIYFIYPQLFYIAVTWALAIGVSRVLLGVHYPLDIVAGATLGTVSVLIAQLMI